MEPALKHRLIGAVVLSALAIIFLPMLMDSRDVNDTASSVPLKAPASPGGDFETKELPLVSPSSTVPDGGVVGLDASHPAPAASTVSPSTGAIGASGPASMPPSSSAAASGVAPPEAAVPAPAMPAPGTASKPGMPVPVASGKTATTLATAAPVIPGASPPVSVTTAPAAASPSAPPAAIASPPIAPAAPKDPIPAANAGGHYVVSLGTYSSSANAQSLVASLQAKQLPAYAEAVTVAGKAETRVRIGPFPQRGDAEAARLKAQQVRSDMPASVTALDAAAPAPVVQTPTTVASSGKLAAVSPASKPAANAASTRSDLPAVASGKNPAPTNNPAASPASGKPAAPSPASAGRGYAVQVSAFRSEDEALTLRNKLRAAGFTAFSEKIQADSGTLFRVRIGPEADRDEADHLRTELSAKLGLSGMVVAYP
jgi:DedD protein